MPLIDNNQKGAIMFKILIIILLVSFVQAKEIPLSLANEISKETSALVFPSMGLIVSGYNSYSKKLVDAIVDDSGYVHILIDGIYGRHKHSWSYLRYDKNGNELFKKDIYSGNYVTHTHSLLVARLLINPDMTVLVFYPDSAFYTCWVKLDKNGEIIERNENKWWRGDARFRICSAGQDSFHIVTSPVGFWGQLIKMIHPEFGEYYEATIPTLMIELFYSNNFSLSGKRIRLAAPYFGAPRPRMISLSDNRIFCFSNDDESGHVWFMDSSGECYDAEKLVKENLSQVCFAKVRIDAILSNAGIKMPSCPDWVGLTFFQDETVGVGIFHEGTLYLIKYDKIGKIIEKGQGNNKLVQIDQMDRATVSPFITSIGRSGRRGEALDKTVCYWGFDDSGNFFLQIY